MKRHKGSFTAVFVGILSIVLVCATAYLFCATIRNKNLSKAQSLLVSQDYEGAMVYFLKADKFSIRPNSEIKRGLAESFIGTGNREGACEQYEKLVELDPSNINDRYLLGMLYIETKDYKKAEVQISALRSMQKEEATSRADELTSHIQTKKLSDFLKDFVDKIIPNIKKLPFSGEIENDSGKEEDF